MDHHKPGALVAAQQDTFLLEPDRLARREEHTIVRTSRPVQLATGRTEQPLKRRPNDGPAAPRADGPPRELAVTTRRRDHGKAPQPQSAATRTPHGRLASRVAGRPRNQQETNMLIRQ